MQNKKKTTSEEIEKNKKQPLFETMETKEEILRFERNNYDKVAIYVSGNFWTATQNSCLFLINVVKVKNKMHVTFDKYLNQDRVYVACHASRLGAMQDLLEYAGCKKMRSDEKVKLYSLPKKVTPEMVKTWVHEDEMKQKKIDAYFLPDSGETKIYSLLRALGHEVVVSIDKMRQSMREVQGRKMLNLSMEMFSLYVEITEDKKTAELAEIKRDMLMLVHEFSFLLTLANDYGLVEDKKMLRMGKILKDISKELGLDKRLEK